jgi:putative intracellular protease/amidase
MSKKTVYLFLFDGYADWEPSYLIPELNKSHEYQLTTFSIKGDSVRSAGGLRIMPDAAMADVKPALAEMIILPGGDAWEERKCREVIPLIKDFNNLNKKIAAICGATLMLSDMGILNNIRHTSNADFYLKRFSEEYSGQRYYVQQPAVWDKNIITASGIYPIEFAAEVFRALHVMDSVTIEKWFQVFKNGIWAE